MARRKLLLFPLNGNAIEALDGVSDDEFEFIGFIDDNAAQRGDAAWPVHDRSALDRYREALVLAVPGGPASYSRRAEIIASLAIERERFATIVHPTASLGRQVKLGVNCLLQAGVVVTSNARLGDHVCILPNSVIHHDTVVGDYTLIGCNVAVAGGVTIGANAYIGSGSNIIHGITIGERALVGLGANVIRSVPAQSVVAGNPAKSLVKNGCDG